MGSAAPLRVGGGQRPFDILCRTGRGRFGMHADPCARGKKRGRGCANTMHGGPYGRGWPSRACVRATDAVEVKRSVFEDPRCLSWNERCMMCVAVVRRKWRRGFVWQRTCSARLCESEMRHSIGRGYARRKMSSHCGSSADPCTLLDILPIASHKGRETAWLYGYVDG